MLFIIREPIPAAEDASNLLRTPADHFLFMKKLLKVKDTIPPNHLHPTLRTRDVIGRT